MRIDPHITVFFDPLSPPLSREDFDNLKMHLKPLQDTACDIVFRRFGVDLEPFSFNFLDDPFPPQGEDSFGIKAVVAYAEQLRYLRRGAPRVIPLIGQGLEALMATRLPVGGAGNRGEIKLFRSVAELHTWLEHLPSGYPKVNPPAPFSPYPRIS